MAWAPAYATTAEAREFITSSAVDVDDVYLDLAVEAASRAVDQHCHRQFGIVGSAEERRYTAVWDRHRCRWIVVIDDVQTTTGLTVTVTAGAITAYTLEPINAAGNGVPWTQLVVDTDSTVMPTGLEHDVTIEASWGWSAVPDTVKQATLLQASRLFARRTSPFGVAGSPELGSELRLLARVDPDVAVVLSRFVRWWAVA